MTSVQSRPVVLDTNVFVAAGFRPDSASGRIVQAVRSGALRMIWSEATRREIEHVVRRIPPLRMTDLETLFDDADRIDDGLHPDRFSVVADPDDRKFAALAHAGAATLISNDDHLLSAAVPLGLEVLKPGDFLRTIGPPD
jgi:putative PIN family toxin of toxin-antitoxin system